MSAKQFQADLFPLIESKFPGQEVKSEWSAFAGQIHQYSPRVDIAIGPFNTGPGPNLIARYNKLMEFAETTDFLKHAFQLHQENLDVNTYRKVEHPGFNYMIHKNQNARCFIAFEIENRNSRKHIMGSVVNAASLGRVGIGIAFNESTLRTFCRIVNYLNFLKSVRKNTYDTTNFLIVSADQIVSLLSNKVSKK